MNILNRQASTVRLLSVIAFTITLMACDSNNNPSTSVESTQLSNSPFQNRPSNLQEITIVSDQNGELLTNADFSDQLTGWTQCNGGQGTTVVNNIASIQSDSCVLQAVDIVPGQDLTLNCEARIDSAGGWTGVGLSFYDENWDFISEPNAAEVTSESFGSYTVSDTAPAGARILAAWVYTVNGASVSNCSVSKAETEEPIDPPAIPPANNELLVNADFSNQLTGWNACNNNTSVSVVNSTAQIGSGTCIQQAIEVSAFQDLTLNCQAKHTGEEIKWTGVGLSFYDRNFDFITEPTPLQVTSDSYLNYSLSGTTPAAGYASVWVYTGSAVSVSNCSLTSSSVEQPLPPTTPTTPPTTLTDGNFCPTYVDSPLYRSRTNTLVIGPEQDNWEELILQASANTEILLKDGEYLMDTETLYLTEPDITIRSLSGNPDAVVIQGRGIFTGASEGFVIAADRITITELTMYGMRRHAVFMKPASASSGNLRDTYVYNMDIYNTGTQQIKGSKGGKNYNAVIACNTIGYTEPAVGDYIGGIGIFEGVDVIVRDNYIYNITGDGTGCDVASPEMACIYKDTPPAIYMRASTDTIVERNTIIESFRGISLGLVQGHVRGIIRNNFIYRSGPGDMGISVENANDTIVEHNTVMVEGYWAPIEVKSGSGGHVFRNNLTNLPINLRGTSGTLIEGNIEYATADDFIAPGNPHLRAGSLAIGAGLTPSVVTSDIDGDTRSGRWDVGADQYTQ